MVGIKSEHTSRCSRTLVDLCENTTVPAVDDVAKAWELDLAGRFGGAVRKRRAALGLSAQQVSDRTRDIGYPVTRVAISKIEGNTRSGKVDVAELLTLAQALDIPPPLLLFPDYPDGEVEALPGRPVPSVVAVNWLAGRREWQLGGDNAGTLLIQAAGSRENYDDPMFERQLRDQTEPTTAEEAEERQRTIKKVLDVRLEGVRRMDGLIERSKIRLWGRGDA
jgi:transcriptional regulator with XRE-family HTH domain